MQTNKIESKPVEDVDGEKLCEIRKSANEMIFILDCMLGSDKRRGIEERTQLQLLSKHAYWVLSQTN